MIGTIKSSQVIAAERNTSSDILLYFIVFGFMIFSIISFSIHAVAAISNDSTLSNIVIKSNNLIIPINPGFSSDIHSYTANVENNISGVLIDIRAYQTSTMTKIVNGHNVGSGSSIAMGSSIQLDVGSNNITYVVTTGDDTGTYTIIITRAPLTLPDTIFPILTYIFAPENNSFVNSNFILNVSVNETNFDSAWVIFDSGFNIMSCSGTSPDYTCSYEIPFIAGDNERGYDYAVYANDTSGNTVQTETRTINYDITAPSIFITSPINGANSSSNTFDLNYTLIETNQNLCWYSNDSGETNSTSQIAGLNFAGLTASEGSNTFTIYCKDKAGNENSSSVVFNVETPVPVVVPIVNTASSGGGGGGGSSYCSTQWSCTGWNACANGIQTRTCSYPTNFCAPTSIKPTTSQACTQAQAGIVSSATAATTTSETPSTGTSGITGAVIGSSWGIGTLGKIGIIALIGLVIVGAVFLSVLNRKAVLK